MVQAVKDGSGFFGELGSECLEGGVGVTIEASVGCRRVEALRVLEPRGRPRHRHNWSPYGLRSDRRVFNNWKLLQLGNVKEIPRNERAWGWRGCLPPRLCIRSYSLPPLSCPGETMKTTERNGKFGAIKKINNETPKPLKYYNNINLCFKCGNDIE